MDIASRLTDGIEKFLVAGHRGLLDISDVITLSLPPEQRHGVYYGYNSLDEFSPDEAMTESGDVVDDLWQILICSDPNMAWSISFGYFVSRRLDLIGGGEAPDVFAGVTGIYGLEIVDGEIDEEAAEKLLSSMILVLDAAGANS